MFLDVLAKESCRQNRVLDTREIDKANPDVISSKRGC